MDNIKKQEEMEQELIDMKLRIKEFEQKIEYLENKLNSSINTTSGNIRALQTQFMQAYATKMIDTFMTPEIKKKTQDVFFKLLEKVDKEQEEGN